MNYIATITSKRQFTIPSEIFEKLKLSEGERVLVTAEDNLIKISRFHNLLKRLAGSIKPPKSFQGLTPDEIVEKAKKQYFKI